MGKKRNLQANPKQPANKSLVTNAPIPDTPTKPSDRKLRESLEEAIGSVPNREEVVERVVSVVRQEIFRGPLPHPRHLQAYEDTCPGIANRIVSMAETAHSRAENRLDKEMEFEFADRRLGMYLGFAALIALLCSGTFIIWLGNLTVGATLLGAAVIGTAVGTFVNGRNRSQLLAEDRAVESDEPNKSEKPSFWKRLLGQK
jgi:uncharacterized membrane protein